MASLSDASFPAMLQNAAAAPVTAPPVTVNQPLQNGGGANGGANNGATVSANQTLTEEFNSRFVLREDFEKLQGQFNDFKQQVIGKVYLDLGILLE